MQAYRKYRDWWMKYEAPHYVGNLFWGNTAEECFEQHIKNLGLYNLMENLLLWEEENT